MVKKELTFTELVAVAVFMKNLLFARSVISGWTEFKLTLSRSYCFTLLKAAREQLPRCSARLISKKSIFGAIVFQSIVIQNCLGRVLAETLNSKKFEKGKQAKILFLPVFGVS